MNFALRMLLMLTLGVVPILLLGCPSGDDDDDSAAGDDDDDATPGDDDDAPADDDDDDDTIGDDDTADLPASVAATVEYTDSVDGEAACDLTVDIVGSKYTGYCDGCDFSFETEATVVDDQSTDACDQVDYWTWYYDGGPYVPWLMIHWNEYSSYYGSYSNVFRSGVAIDYTMYGGGYYVGPYFATLHYDGSSGDTTFTRTGDDIAWTLNSTASVYLGAYSYDCGISEWSYAEYAYAGDFEITEDIACDAMSADVWTFQAVEGATYSITVDTIAAGTAFDATFHMNDPDGCYLVTADDNFDCSFPPPTYACPSYELTGATAGEYQIVVYENTYDPTECVDGTIGEYVIRVDAEEDPMLVLAQDDIATYAEKVTSVSLTGTITQ